MAIKITRVSKGKCLDIDFKYIQEKLQSTIGNDIRCRDCYRKLASISQKDKTYTDILMNYCLQYKHEADVADSTLTTAILHLSRFAEKVNKPFAVMTRDDVIGYLERMKVGNRWKRTYALFLITVTRFFKWLYSPNVNYKERPKPEVVVNLGRVKFDKKTYKPKDMWTLEDNEIFFKYCPSPKIKCYHAIAVDTGARPHEILKLKIEDIIWPSNGGPPTFMVSGKTGTRSLTSLRYHRYIREWIERHPKRAVSSSILICSKKTGGILNEKSLRERYKIILRPYFTKLLDEPIGQQDRNQIQQLLRKPWNPYIFRHTTATEFLGQGRLTRDLGNQWFGWSEKSNMASIYENFDGHEAAQVLAESFGVAPQTKPLSLPRLVECPNVTCKELNNPDSPFCVKCRSPLSVAGHLEREQEILELKEQMAQSKQEIKDRFQAYESKMAEFVHDIQSSLNHEERSRPYDDLMLDKMRELLDRTTPGWFQEVFGPKAHRLTPKAHEKCEEMLRILEPQIDAENRQREVEIQRRKKVLMDSMERRT